jgi:hypothetical protein
MAASIASVDPGLATAVATASATATAYTPTCRRRRSAGPFA